ncbi:MAG: HAD family hydrolase [Thermomicrobiales bacterium]|nr:HAD family hydrolase [Thermomicrobiales bacterium]
MARRITTFFDVDNTLLDNERAKRELWAQFAAHLGPDGAQRFDDIYEQVRRDLGLVSLPLVLEALDAAAANDPALTPAQQSERRYVFAGLLMGFPYGDYLYPGALAAVRHARAAGQVAILSEGDEVFQPHKIWRTGLYQEVAGAVIIFRHKLEHLRELVAAYPADHYLLVEDKPDILQAVKRTLGRQVTTIFVRQGKYANAPTTADGASQPDVTLGSIAEFATLALPALAGDGAYAPRGAPCDGSGPWR